MNLKFHLSTLFDRLCLLSDDNPFFNLGMSFKVREGRTPEKPTDAENLEANISEVMLIVQVCVQ